MATVRDLIVYMITKLGLEGDVSNYVYVDTKLFRPVEADEMTCNTNLLSHKPTLYWRDIMNILFDFYSTKGEKIRFPNFL